MSKISSVSPLDAHVGYWLRLVSNHVSHAFALKVEASGVTVAEWVILRELLRLGCVNPCRLADALGMTRGAISKLVDRLEAKKFILRRAGKGDQRYQTVALTPSGRKIVPVLAALADQNDAEFFGHLNAGQRLVLIDLLKEIVRQKGLKEVPVD